MYRHVLCVYPYRVEDGRRIGFWPPLGLEMIAAALARHARAVDVIDLRHEPGRAVDFPRPNTDLVCFSVNWDYEGDLVRDEIRSIPEGVFTIFGGRHATLDPETWLAACPNVDVLVRGDGEEAVEEIAAGACLDEIAGISYRAGERVVHTGIRRCAPVREDLRPDRTAATCDLLLKRGIRKNYIVQARLEIARRPDVLGMMERAGVSVLLLGIESAQDTTLRSMGKGFDTMRVREYFRTLRRTGMVLLGYFIVGNIGETEDEMLAIAPFARELGVDILNLCSLRNEPYSGMDELLAKSPGYHAEPGGKRPVYSDQYSVAHIKRASRQINRAFYTPRHVLRILAKCLRKRVISPGMIMRLPWFLACKAARRLASR